MENNELKDYKKKLQHLSENEEKLRDIYLRQIQEGKISGPLTGYASIDKPALQYYIMEKLHDIKKQENFAQGLLRQNKDNLNRIALEYFGSKISYKTYFEQSKKLVKALQKSGIKKGNYVTICMPGIPEAMYSIFALAYLGAAGIYLPPYLDKETAINDINKDNSKILIIMDLFYKNFKETFDEIVEKTSIEKIVVVPTLNSSILGKLQKKEIYEADNVETYNDFIEEGKNENLTNIADYEEKMPLAVVYSSGTTGVLKGVLLSHDTFNNSASSYLAFGFNLTPGQKVYQAIPVWSSTGLVADGTSALYYGCTLYQNPKFEPELYSKNLGLYKNNWGIATTEMFNGLVDLNKKKLFKIMLKLGIYDYSQLENVYIGGTFSTPNDRNRLNDILKSVGCDAKVRASYGTCENGSIATAELNGIEHPDYSVGFPIPGVTVAAIDENNNELPYQTRGELVIKTDCGMLRYYNRPDLNEKIFFNDEEWLGYKHTGDIGYIMPSGDVIYEGRANDISIVDNKKIYNFDVKKAILSDEDVFDCEVFTHSIENKLCANIVFKNNYDNNNYLMEKLQDIQQKILEYFSDIDYVPELFKVRNCFPMASSTKRDFKAIKEETDNYIFVDKNYLVSNLSLRKIK